MHYLAYGSNLHPLRLQQRISDCRLLGTVELKQFALRFHKLGQDGSGKCNLLFTGNTNDQAYCALYRISPGGKKTLDIFEGLGKGYGIENFQLEFEGRRIKAFAYLGMQGYLDDSLRPFDWYKDLVLLGMEFCGFPPGYIRRFAGIETAPDSDPVRVKENQDLLLKIRGFNKHSCPTADG